MQAALVAGDFARGMGFADAVVAETTRLLDTIHALHMDRTIEPDSGTDADLDRHRAAEREAELISALRVYRNAAFVFRRMAGVDGEPDPALATVCGVMIEQGHDHWQALTDPPEPPGQGP
jgi:hypothetical protein